MSSCSKPNVPGGQAGSSSRIENYLGFPTGISGLDLAGRAQSQALKFGARLMVAKAVTRMACDAQRYTVETEDGAHASARTVIVATGATYRKPALENLAPFEGAGVYTARRQWRRSSVLATRSSWSAAAIPQDRQPSFSPKRRRVSTC